MPNERKRATVYDVAQAAGVSAQTVSRVINNQDRVAIKTKNRVLRAMEALDYQPNLTAQRFKTQRSYAIQVFIFHPSYPIPYTSILSKAKSLGYKALFEIIDPNSEAELRNALDDAARQLIDGIILIAPPEIPNEQIEKMARGISVVQLGGNMGIKSASVVTDQYVGGQLATQHLIDLGHRQIAEISGLIESSNDAFQRHQSYLDTLHRNGLAPVMSVIGEYGGFSLEGGYHAAHQLLDSGNPFTAVFAANDNLALGAIKAFTERGFNVPVDISVIGFDDTFGSAFYNPALTTIHQDFEAMGTQAVEYVINLIEKPETVVHQRVLYPELMIRESTHSIP